MSRKTKLGFKVRSSLSPVVVKVEEEVENIKVDRARSVAESSTGMERSVSEPLLDTLISHSRVLTDTERYELPTTPQTRFSDTELDTRYFEIKGSRKRKQMTFLNKWLKDYTWLHYCRREIHKGGWCLPCCLFLTDLQKELLGAFVKSPFVNYNKANEVCKKHANKEYHVIADERAYTFKS